MKLSPVRITRIIFWIASSYSFVWGQIFSRKNILACATLCASTSRLSRIASTKYSRAYILVLKTSVRFKSPLIFTWKSLCDLLSFGSLVCGCVFGGGGGCKAPPLSHNSFSVTVQIYGNSYFSGELSSRAVRISIARCSRILLSNASHFLYFGKNSRVQENHTRHVTLCNYCLCTLDPTRFIPFSFSYY